MKPILTEGKVLSEVAPAVPPSLFGRPELVKTLNDMSEALGLREDGVALAAPQIGVSQRIFIVSGKIIGRSGKIVADQEFINPVIKKTSRKKGLLEEGCLSVPGVYGLVKRAEKVTIVAYSRDGKKFERSAGGLLAQVFQHEIDHLDGILFTSKASHLHDLRKD